jgi:hypothetical protein
MGVGAWGVGEFENSFMPSLGKSGVPAENPTPKMIYLIGKRTAVPICANPDSTATPRGFQGDHSSPALSFPGACFSATYAQKHAIASYNKSLPAEPAPN